MKRYQLPLLILLSSLLSGCVSAAMTSASMAQDRTYLASSSNNHVLTAQAYNALGTHQDIKSKSNINVSVFNNIVLLSGEANTQKTKDDAQQIIQKLVGKQRKIVNTIRIGQPASLASSAEDSWITTKIVSQLFVHRKVNPRQIKIVTEDNVVYLMGRVYENEAKTVINIARHTGGVKKVVTLFRYITLSPAPTASTEPV